MNLQGRARRLEKQLAAAHDAASPFIGRLMGKDGTITVDGEDITEEEFRRRYPRGIIIAYPDETPEPDTP